MKFLRSTRYQSLINRGSVTFWFDKGAVQKWQSINRTGKPGRPDTYSDDAINDRGGRQVIPPDKTAKLQRGKTLPCLKARDEAIRRIEELGSEGRVRWKKEINYHRRSRVEMLMFRYKTILGDRLVFRNEPTQATEVAIKLDVLNRMTELGWPESYKVAS